MVFNRWWLYMNRIRVRAGNSREHLSGLVLQTVNFLFSFALVTLLFAMIYKILPSVHIAWKDVAVGSIITAALFSIGKALQPISRQLEIPLRSPRHRRAIRRPRQAQLRQINFDSGAIWPDTPEVAAFSRFPGIPGPGVLPQRLKAQRLPVTHHLWLREFPLRLRSRDPQKQLLGPHSIGLKRRNVCKRVGLFAMAAL